MDVFVSKPGTVAEDFGSNPEKSENEDKGQYPNKIYNVHINILRVPMHYEGIQLHSPFKI